MGLEDLESMSSNCVEETTTFQEVAPDYSAKRSHETKNSKTYVGVSGEVLETSKNVQAAINHYLLNLIEEKVKQNFSKAFEFAEKENSTELNSAIREAHMAVFYKGPKDPISKIRRYLALFPSIEAELMIENPDLKPLFCQFEVWKHRKERWQKTAKILGRISSIAGYAGIIASGILALPALPVALMGVGALKVVSGSMGLATNLSSMSEHSAGRAAKEILNFQSELKSYIADLNTEKMTLPKNERGPLEERIKNLEISVNLIEVHTPELKNAIKGRKKIRKEIISNLLNIGLGGAMFSGGLQLQKKFSDFRSSKVEYQDPLPDQPSTDYGFGGLSPDP